MTRKGSTGSKANAATSGDCLTLTEEYWISGSNARSSVESCLGSEWRRKALSDIELHNDKSKTFLVSDYRRLRPDSTRTDSEGRTGEHWDQCMHSYKSVIKFMNIWKTLHSLRTVFDLREVQRSGKRKQNIKCIERQNIMPFHARDESISGKTWH